VQQEWLDRKFPSPHEWSWMTRKDFRNARWDENYDEEDDRLAEWAQAGSLYRRILKRLEDPNIDGAGLEDQDEGGILVAGIGKTGFDISKKPEAWRRGYYEVLMGAARVSEHLDGWVRDKTRGIIFPANVVVGPSNPNPRPVPPGAASAPREEDCEPYEGPERYYVRILTTNGFTEKQRVNAALAYGAWLDFKKTPETALEMYKWALDIATSNTVSPKPIVDTTTGILDPSAGLPSSNILSAMTALAVHHAVNSNLSNALPIFLSILRARRSLPDPPATMHSTLNPDEDNTGFLKNVMFLVRSVMIQPPYPPPPDDGTTPPSRNPKERCEEAGIMTHIGEILYASSQTKTSREDGLAWTREAVDVAEEQLRRKGVDKDGKKTCKQCLEVGLGNWMTMVKQMAREEKEAKAQKVGGWLGFGGESQKDVAGRWEREHQVIIERMRRAEDILSSPAQAASGSSFFSL
jgi:hypothetical protein